MEPSQNPPPAHHPRRLRKAKNYAKRGKTPIMERTAVKSYYQQSVAKLEGLSPWPELVAFLPGNASPWVWKYLRYALSAKARFPNYDGGDGFDGIYRIQPASAGEPISLAIAGDWGTGTHEAWAIAHCMAQSNPDFTIHLGDIYYVGDSDEIERNYLGGSSQNHDGVHWPRGRQGSFALNGNHEMYANGGPFFHMLLPKLGMNGDPRGQQASYFCLDAGHWRIIALDSAYNSVGAPILSQIPFLNELPGIGGDCHLEPSLLAWLRDVVKVSSDRKPTLLLSHHNYFSAFPEVVYTKPARQIAGLFAGQDLVWLWGHEHRLAIYDRFATPEGMAVYGRCAGHGGMPVTIATPDAAKAPLRLYDARQRKLESGHVVGINGFVNVRIDGDRLSLEYRDIDDAVLFSETFSPGEGGRLHYRSHDRGILAKP